MNKKRDSVRLVLEKLDKKKITRANAYQMLRTLPYDDLGFAKIDTHRLLRKGFPEVIFCKGKQISQIRKIAGRANLNMHPLLFTKANKRIFSTIKGMLPEAEYNEQARIVFVKKKKRVQKKEFVLVITAGTSDIPVAEEAATTLEIMDNKVKRLYDVGVAGIHRLLEHSKLLDRANVIIVVAGMEGALVSVVSGLVRAPVIAVPTSIGYGASFKGVAALLAMLNCCAPGVTVVNIDNGFGAGYFASLVNR